MKLCYLIKIIVKLSLIKLDINFRQIPQCYMLIYTWSWKVQCSIETQLNVNNSMTVIF